MRRFVMQCGHKIGHSALAHATALQRGSKNTEKLIMSACTPSPAFLSKRWNRLLPLPLVTAAKALKQDRK
jgi:hypothetical protein